MSEEPIYGKYKITFWTTDGYQEIMDAGGEFDIQIIGKFIDIKLSSQVRSILFERPGQ